MQPVGQLNDPEELGNVGEVSMTLGIVSPHLLQVDAQIQAANHLKSPHQRQNKECEQLAALVEL